MLDVQHVTKKYKKNVACDDVSFTLEPGTITVLLGPNGAGKSTIIKSIIGYLRYQGTILVNGKDNKTLEARRQLGYVPELPSLYPNLTVMEHMEFLARAYKLENYESRVQNLLDTFELQPNVRKFGDELSKGMQQKVNLCLGLLPEPDILLLDEPMVGLDPHAIKSLRQLLEDMRAQGKTIFVSTHIIDTIDMIWDRTIIMKDGQVRANLTKEEVENSSKSLEDYFFEVTEGEQ